MIVFRPMFHVFFGIFIFLKDSIRRIQSDRLNSEAAESLRQAGKLGGDSIYRRSPAPLRRGEGKLDLSELKS